MIGNFLLVMLGGAIGAAIRYAASVFGPSLWGDSFPWATLLVNGCGCLAIGVFLALDSQKNFESSHLLVAVGILGALTTFSTFSAESISMLVEGRSLLAVINILGNLLLSLAACCCGLWIGKLVSG